jgi:uncharacterized membrane protein
MTGVLQAGALLCALLGLLAAGAVLVRSRDVRLSIGVLLEFLLAAGLLRLTDDPGWRALGAAAAVVAVRALVAAGPAR